MATELLPDLSTMSDVARQALTEGAWSDPNFWSEWEAHTVTGEEVRRHLEAGQEHFTREDVVKAINYAEATRVMAHIMIGGATRNLEAAKRSMTSAVCTWCQWTYRDEVFDWPKERDFTAEDAAEVNVRVGAQLREHIKVCPNHPMRELESQLAAALGGG